MNFIGITLSIVIIFISIWICYRIWNRELFKMIAGMNDLKALPLIGLGHHFIGKSKKDYYKIALDLIYDDNVWTPIQFWVCTKLSIFLDNSEDIHRILTCPDCYEKGSGYDKVLFANGLITSKPLIWLEHRKLLNSAFHIKLLKRYIQNFNDISHKIVLDVERLCGKGGFNMAQIIGDHMTDVQMRTLFGIVESSNVISKLKNNILVIIQYLGESGLQSMVYPIKNGLHNLFYSLVSENEIKLKLKENYALVRKNRIPKEEGMSINADEPQNCIKRIVTLRNEGRFDESDFQDHIHTMLLAGIDTIIVTLNNIFMLLAMNPVAQEKCYRELVDNLGTHIHDIDIDQLNKLEYLNRTLKECLCLIPTVPIIQRKSSIDLSLGGSTIPKGVDICIPIIKIHHSRKYWGDQPTLFNPDHFLEENIAKRPAVSYIPYSYGNRNCIGSKYAQWLMRIVVAHLISKFKFTTNLKFDELKFVFGVTLNIEHHQLIEVEKR